jgi:tetratricopeptide (TPR) repeat protein
VRPALLIFLVLDLIPLLSRLPGRTFVDYASHLGGATAGLLLGMVILALWPKGAPALRFEGFAAVAGTAGFGAFAVSGLLLVLDLRTYFLAFDGDLHFRKAEYDLALRDYDQLLRRQPASLIARYGRTRVYEEKGEHELAIEEYKQVVRIAPNQFNNHLILGKLYDHAGETDRAIEQFDEAIRRMPACAACLADRALARAHAKDTEGALADFSKSLEIAPRNAEVYNNRAWTLFKAGRFMDALIDASVSAALDPKDTHTLDTRAHIYLALNRLPDAIADFDAVIKAGDAGPVSLVGRGDVYEKQGLTELARSDYRQALAAKPTTKDEREAQDRARDKLREPAAPPRPAEGNSASTQGR